MAARHEMLMERNTPVPMRDGAVLRGDVFRPKAEGKFPVLMTFGPYGKDVPLKEFMQEAWDAIEKLVSHLVTSCPRRVITRTRRGKVPLDGV